MQNTSPLQPEAAAPRAVYEVPSLALLERFIEASESAAGLDLSALAAGSLIWLKTVWSA